MGNLLITHFADGEFSVSYEESIRGRDVFLVQSTFPNSDNLMELLLMIDAAKRASARHIIAVIPYFGWARQDRKDKPRVSIGAKLVADLLSVAGIDRLITMDLHADKWLIFPENIGPNVAIDESSLSNGELYTFVTNRERHCGEGCLIAIVEGTKSEVVVDVLRHIDEAKRNSVKEVTLDLSDSMRKIVSQAFPKAKRVIDRFHIQKLACDAVQELRIKYRWDAIQQCNDEMEETKLQGRNYIPERFSNGDTRKELLARSRYLLFKDAGKWSKSQKERAEILFSEYPSLKKAYGLSHSLRMIFAKNTIKDTARLSMANWYNNVEKAEFHSFNIAVR